MTAVLAFPFSRLTLLTFMKSALLPFVFLVLLWSGCKTSTIDPDPAGLGHPYFPLEVKDFRIYEVTETRYLNDQATATTYQVREWVDTLYTNLANEPTYRMLRSRRADASQPWVDDSIYVASRSGSDLRVTRHNVKVVQLIFPVRNDKSWNANAFNGFGINEFSYTKVGEPYSLDGRTYPNTATVIQGSTSNLIELDRREEVYAQNIGLVYKNYTRLNYCNDPAKCPFNRQPELYVQEGIRRIDKLISFGKMP